MSEKSKIAWCDSTVNFWSGCTKVSLGCANCYAEARDARMLQEKVIHWGKDAPRLKSKGAVKQALAMNHKPWICDQTGEAFASNDLMRYAQGHNGATFHRRRIFSLSLGDWLDEEVPIEWLAEMLDTIRQCSDVTWILCTKRPESFFSRMAQVNSGNAFGVRPSDKYKTNDWAALADWINAWRNGDAPKNIILLTSIENEPMAEKRILKFLRIPAACHGLSLEPLLCDVQLTKIGHGYEYIDALRGLHRQFNSDGQCRETKIGKIDWIIIGGESGANARPCNVDWIRSLVQQGQAAGVATFVKQLGANPYFTGTAREGDETDFILHLNDKKGGDISEWPEDLRIQQWPKGF